MSQPSSIEANCTTGHRTAFSAVAIPAHKALEEVGNHRWRPAADVSLSLDDLGSLQGATLVERLRTVAGKPLDASEHLERLQRSASQLNIQWPRYLTMELIQQCVQRNEAAHAGHDFGIVILLTPGSVRSRPVGGTPTVIVHTTDLHWSQLAHWYQFGQPLVVANNRNVPVQCWSPHMKTRSRMHYFVADQQAAASSLPHAGAVMLSLDDSVTESSVANLLVIDDQQLVSPPIDSVLHGLSLRRTIRLAEQTAIKIRYQPISLDTARNATGLLLTGSSGCLWAASQLGETIYQDPTHQPVYQVLRDAWIRDIGLDYVQQAIERSQTLRAG